MEDDTSKGIHLPFGFSKRDNLKKRKVTDTKIFSEKDFIL